MKPIRYLLRNLNLLNGLLLGILAAGASVTVVPSLDPAVRLSLPAVRAAATPAAVQEKPPRTLVPGDYALISEQNLFHPERKVPPEKAVEKAVARPEIFLNGTLITDEGSYAFIEDRKAPPPAGGERGKRQLTLRKGATLGGYLLSEVAADRIVLVKGEDRFVVTLTDREKRRGDERAVAPAMTPKAAGTAAPAPRTDGSPSKGTPESGIGLIAPRAPLSPAAPSQPRTAAPSGQAEAVQGPGIGGSGAWPPTRSSVEQTRQKLQEAQQIRREQLQKSPAASP